MHFWAFTKQDAIMLAKALYDEGLLVLTLAPTDDGGERWNIEAGIRYSVNEVTSNNIVEKFVRLAAGKNAIYDGWGTSI